MAEKRPPEQSPGAISALLLYYYPFKNVSKDSLKPFPSYGDRNIYFEGARETCGGSSPFLNCGVPSREVEGMNAMMFLLSERGIPCSRSIPTRRGDYILEVSKSELLQQGKSCDAAAVHCVRVLTFIPGIPMDKLEKRYLTPELAYSVGKMVGTVDMILQDFKHSAIFEREVRSWDLMYFTDVKQYIPQLAEEEKRKVANSVVAMFEEHVLPTIPKMKKGVIHNDMNGLNILFNVSADKCELCGLIDFGDSVYTCYLFELAIMLAHGMCGKENPVEFVGPMFKGYRDMFPLSKAELNCLYYAVLARLCLAAVNGEYCITLEPWNTYLLTIPPEGWKLISLLLSLGKKNVESKWGLWGNNQ